jgi:hypothetical protein
MTEGAISTLLHDRPFFATTRLGVNIVSKDFYVCSGEPKDVKGKAWQ